MFWHTNDIVCKRIILREQRKKIFEKKNNAKIHFKDIYYLLLLLLIIKCIHMVRIAICWNTCVVWVNVQIEKLNNAREHRTHIISTSDIVHIRRSNVCRFAQLTQFARIPYSEDHFHIRVIWAPWLICRLCFCFLYGFRSLFSYFFFNVFVFLLSN